MSGLADHCRLQPALGRVRSGEPEPGDLRALLSHLIRGCPECCSALAEAWGTAPASEPQQQALAAALRRFQQGLIGRREAGRAARTEAQALFERLRDRSEAHQRLLVLNAAPEIVGPLCEKLIEVSRASRQLDARRCLQFAELAVAAAQRLPDDANPELRIRAHAERGNARRKLGDLGAAEMDLHRASQWAMERATDPLLQAELSSLLGSLAKDRTRFDEALDHLQRALGLYARFDHVDGRIRTLLQIAQVQGDRGASRAAQATLDAAVALTTASTDSRLCLLVFQTAAWLALEAGELADAGRKIAGLRPLVDRVGTPVDRCNLDWLGGRLSRECGDLATAERRLGEVRDRFIAAGQPGHAAMVEFDLLEIDARRGDLERLAERASQAAQVFHALGVEREAIAALAALARTRDLDRAAALTAVAGAANRARHRVPAGTG